MIRDDIMAVKKEIKDLKEQSFTMELLKDFKKQNKRQYVIILVILLMWFFTIGYLVYVLNDIGSEEITETTTNNQEVSDVDTIDNSYIINGDNYGEDKTN